MTLKRNSRIKITIEEEVLCLNPLNKDIEKCDCIKNEKAGICVCQKHPQYPKYANNGKIKSELIDAFAKGICELFIGNDWDEESKDKKKEYLKDAENILGILLFVYKIDRKDKK